MWDLGLVSHEKSCTISDLKIVVKFHFLHLKRDPLPKSPRKRTVPTMSKILSAIQWIIRALKMAPILNPKPVLKNLEKNLLKSGQYFGHYLDNYLPR